MKSRGKLLILGGFLTSRANLVVNSGRGREGQWFSDAIVWSQRIKVYCTAPAQFFPHNILNSRLFGSKVYNVSTS